MKELRDKAEKHVFQAEVDRMMKLIINSLYKNKEVCIILDLFINIYILCVFTEKPYSKPLERNVVYIPIITLSHAMSVCQNNPWLYNLTGRQHLFAARRKTVCKYFTASILVVM